MRFIPLSLLETQIRHSPTRTHRERFNEMPEQIQEQDNRRRRNRRLLNRIADPEHGFPIIRSLILKFAPVLIEYLMKSLPIWLADVESVIEDEPIV